jgi:polysaccharide export outer membrane protein
MLKKILLLAAALLTLPAYAENTGRTELGSGDVVRISVYGSPDLNIETRVGDDGKISFPLIGEVPVKGLVPAEAEKKIAKRLVDGGFVRSPQVNILVTTLQSQQVAVLGYVNRPGKYPLESRHSVADLLAAAGGTNIDAGDVLTLVRTEGSAPNKMAIDLPAMLSGSGADKNVDVKAGDIIYVERAAKFYIYGEVQRPGSYRLERDMTIVQALSTGGGLSARGTERGVKVKRRGTDGKMQIRDVKLDDVVETNDVIFVKESLF